MNPEADLRGVPTLLGERLMFPDPRGAGARLFPGLVAIGGDLSVERLLLAYRSGIFPWTTGPVTWWSPDPRAILDMAAFHVPRSLKRVLRRADWQAVGGAPVFNVTFKVTVNCAFREVIEGCAAQRGAATWISPEFIRAYTRLHGAGHAHSLECWRNGELVGGIYGVAVGGLFAGESMFHRVSDASKVALCFLLEHLKARGFDLFDLQMLTPVTAQLGGKEISREEYLRRVERSVRLPVKFGPPGGPVS